MANLINIFILIKCNEGMNNGNENMDKCNKSMEDLTKELENKDKTLFAENKVKDVFLSVDRGDFIDSKETRDSNKCNDIYEDKPKNIGHNATISAPYMHAKVLELVYSALKDKINKEKQNKEEQNKKELKCLDIGSGTGILSLLLKRLLGPNSEVIGIEHIKDLVDKSIENIEKATDNPTKTGVENPNDKDTIQILEEDGLNFKTDEKFDCIHIGAAVNDGEYEKWKNLLKEGGILVFPKKKDNEEKLTKITKNLGSESYEEKELIPVRYVPLTKKENQLNSNNKKPIII